MTAARSIARILLHRNRVAEGTALGTPGAEPACAFGYLVRQDLADIRKDLEDLKATARWLLYLTAGAVLGAVLDKFL